MNQHTEPLYADFNEFDEDGAYIMTPFLNMHFQKINFVPTEGEKICISDGDIEMIGTLSLRHKAEHNYWVSIVDKESIKNVSRDVWYHNENLKK